MRLLVIVFPVVIAAFLMLNMAVASENTLQNSGWPEKIRKLEGTLPGYLPQDALSKISRFLTPTEEGPEDEIKVIVELDELPLIEFRKDNEAEIRRLEATGKHEAGIQMIDTAKLMERRLESHRNTISGIRSEVKSKLKRDFGAVFKENRDYAYVFNGFAASVKRKQIDEIRKLPHVKNVFIDERVSIQLSNSVPKINADDVWLQIHDGRNVTGYNITVAVIDTGIDYTHHDLGNCTQSDFLGGSCSRIVYGWDFYNDDGDPMDDNGHGTHCAGIIGANGTLKGVAPDVKLIAYKVLDSYGWGWTSDIIEAIENATLMDVDVISISLGWYGFSDSYMKEPIDNAVLNGTVVVVAAGNSGPIKDSVGSPASVLSAITVGASDNSDTIASFSSRGFAYFLNGSIAGVKPDVVAPGVDINSTVPKSSCELCDPSGYRKLSGTSMATPHVAGVVALLMQSHPEWSSEQIKSAISNTAVDIHEDPNTQGSGRIDALKAYNASSLIFPNNLFFIDLANQTDIWNATEYFNITNLMGFNLSYNITFETSHPAINVTPASYTLNLSGNSSVLLNFTLLLNNSEFDYGTHYGAVLINISNNQSLRMPFVISKYTNSMYCPSGMVYINATTRLNRRMLCYIGDEENLTFVINSSNIIFDCNGSTFEKEHSFLSMPIGIQNNGFRNVTIKNCTFQNYGYGFYINNTADNNMVQSYCNFNDYGIYLENSTNVSINGVNSNYNLYGIVSHNSTGNYIINSTSILNFYGIIMEKSRNTTIENVTLENNIISIYGINSSNNKMDNLQCFSNMADIFLLASGNNTISNTNVSNNFFLAIYLSEAPNNVFVNNSLTSNYYAIYVDGYSLNDFMQDMNSSNKVNEKPVLYLINRQNQTINISGDPGFVGVVNSSNMTVKDLEIDHGGSGVLFAYTNNSRISNVSISNSYAGVYLSNSFNDVLEKLELSGNNTIGIQLMNSSGNLINNTMISGELSSIGVYAAYSNNTFLNTTYSYEFCSYGCKITRQWYLAVNVTNSSNAPQQDANVSVRDSFGSFLWSENTSSNGMTATHVITEYVDNEGDVTSFTSHNITATKYGYHVNSTNFTINISMTAMLTLSNDTDPPGIYDLFVDALHNRAAISWRTTEESRSIVYYGTSMDNLSLNATNLSLSFAHDFLLTNLISNSTYYFNISSCDYLDNCVMNGTYNFSTAICQENWIYTDWSSCIGGTQTREGTDLNSCGTTANRSVLSQSCGQGGNVNPGITASPNLSKFSVFWDSVAGAETKTVSINKDKIDITWSQLKFKNNRNSISFTVEQLENKPSSVPQPAGVVYSYVKIDALNVTDDDLESAKLGFKVEKKWVDNENINKSLIYLNRYTNTWERLDTAFINETTDYLNFESRTPGFSFFAITGEEVSAAPQQICMPDSKTCSGDKLQKCTPDGYSWQTMETCEYGCDQSLLICKQKSALSLGCNLGEKRCAGNDLQECNALGQWAVIKNCDYGCENGKCKTQSSAFDITAIFMLALLIIIIIAAAVLFLTRRSKKGGVAEWAALEEKWKGKLASAQKKPQPAEKELTWEELERKWKGSRKQ